MRCDVGEDEIDLLTEELNDLNSVATKASFSKTCSASSWGRKARREKGERKEEKKMQLDREKNKGREGGKERKRRGKEIRERKRNEREEEGGINSHGGKNGS